MNYDNNNADRELDSLYAAITGRSPFRYDAASDPLYRAAADRYIQNGRMAMRDTMGRAAALTGGYGSSYAQAVGQQQYDEYLRALSQALPEYYSMAWQRYEAQGRALQDAYDRAWQRRQDEYQRQRDEAADALAAEALDYERGRDAAADAAAAEDRDYSRRRDSYQQLVKLISTAGYVPTDRELADAGLTRAQADALLRQYLQGQKSGGGSSAGASGSGQGRASGSGRGQSSGSGRRTRSSGGGGGGKIPSQHLT